MRIQNYDKSVNAVKEAGTHIIDCEVKGLELWVRETKTGLTKTFRLRYRANGTQRRVSLGKYPVLKLAEAKAMAIDHLQELKRKNYDPAEKAKLGTFKQHYEKWIQQQRQAAEANKKEKRTPRKGEIGLTTCNTYETAFKRHSKPLHDMHIMDITDEDINRLVDNVSKTKGTATAHKVRSAIASMFRDIISDSTIIKKSPVTAACTVRVETNGNAQKPLTNDQIKELWQAIAKIDPIRRGVVKMALFTGMRKRNIELMKWEDISDDRRIWTISDYEFKGQRVHRVPLSVQAQKVLEEMEQHKNDFKNKGKHVFPFQQTQTPEHPMRFHELLKFTLKVPYATHAFRKTVYTIMRELRIDKDVVKACVGHQYQEDDLEKTYNIDDVRRNDGITVIDELKRMAFQEYADHVERIARGYYDKAEGVQTEGMISIVNISKQFKEKGKQEYVLKINGRQIVKFNHKREQGLAECLRQAANAIDKMEADKQ